MKCWSVVGIYSTWPFLGHVLNVMILLLLRIMYSAVSSIFFVTVYGMLYKSYY